MVDLRDWSPPEEILSLIPAGMARLHGALPIGVSSEGLQVCLVDPLNPQTVEDLRFAIGREIQVLIAPDYIVEDRISQLYGGDGKAM
jgi:type IV pilus assembly protein PilB